MEKPRDFDTAKAWGEYEPLPAGGYVCEIIGVDEALSKTGKKMIKIALDIFEGEHKGRFMDVYKNDTRDFKKWPASAVVHQLVEDNDGNTHGRFKQFTDCTIESNKGFEIKWGKEFGSCFKGKLIGAVFGKEQYEGEGGLKWSTKPRFFRTVEEIRAGKFKIPEDKLLDTSSNNNGVPAGFSPVKDEEIPF